MVILQILQYWSSGALGESGRQLKQMHSVVNFWNLVLWGIVEEGLKRENLHAQLNHKQILKEMDFSVPDATVRVLENHKRCA